MREMKLLLLKGRRRSVTALGRAAAGVRVLRELVRSGNLLGDCCCCCCLSFLLDCDAAPAGLCARLTWMWLRFAGMRRDGCSHPKKPSGDAKPRIRCANRGVAVASCALSRLRWALGSGVEGRHSAHQKPPEMFPLLFSPKPTPCSGEEVTPCTAPGYIRAWTAPRAARVPEQVAARRLQRWLYITPIELPAVSLQIRAEIVEALLMQMNFDRGGGCVRATGVCRALCECWAQRPPPTEQSSAPSPSTHHLSSPSTFHQATGK